MEELGPQSGSQLIEALDKQFSNGKVAAKDVVDAMHKAKRIKLRPPQPGETEKKYPRNFFWYVATPERDWPLRTSRKKTTRIIRKQHIFLNELFSKII